MGSERDVVFAIALAANATDETPLPKFSLVCSDANIEAAPKGVKRINNQGRDNIGSLPAGFDVSGFANGAEVDAAQLGYLFNAFLGNQEIVADEHVLTPAAVPPYVKGFIDRGLDLGTSTPTQTAIGGMFEELSFELTSQQMLKIGFKFKACSIGTPVGALVGSKPDYPMSFISLRAGDFKIGYDGAAMASDRSIKDFKLNLKQGVDGEDGITIDSDQPTSLTPGERELTHELTRKFDGANALAEYNAWRLQKKIGISIELKMNSDTERVLIEVPVASVTGSYPPAAGTGTKALMATLKCEGEVPGSDPLVKVTVKDDTIVNYT